MEKFARKFSKTIQLNRKLRTDSNCELDLTDYDLNKEVDRNRTFVDNHWSHRNAQSEDLALLGFYFVMKPGTVCCYFCNLMLEHFPRNCEILKEHLKFSPNCPLLIRRQTDNIPIDSEELDKILPPVTYDECGSGRRKKSKVEEDVKYPEFRLPSVRVDSFKHWPVGIKQKPKDLAEAGFFYKGQSDRTICFSCGHEIGQWEEDDNPWVEHKKFSSDCNYLKMNHEQLKINEKKYEELMKSKIPAEEVTKDDEEDSEEVKLESACKICLTKKSSVVFLPCKHVVVCGECSFGVEGKCPYCRSEITDKIPLYYA